MQEVTQEGVLDDHKPLLVTPAAAPRQGPKPASHLSERPTTECDDLPGQFFRVRMQLDVYLDHAKKIENLPPEPLIPLMQSKIHEPSRLSLWQRLLHPHQRVQNVFHLASIILVPNVRQKRPMRECWLLAYQLERLAYKRSNSEQDYLDFIVDSGNRLRVCCNGAQCRKTCPTATHSMPVIWVPIRDIGTCS